MTGRMTKFWVLVGVLAIGAALATGCSKKSGTPDAKLGTAKGPNPETLPPVIPPPTEPLSALEEQWKVQPGRSSSDAALPLPWQDVTATGSADAGGRQPVRKWIAPVVLIGREQVWLGDKAVAKLQCQGKQPEYCTPEALKQQGVKAHFGFAPGDVVDGKLPGLAAATVEWKDKQVTVIADRRITWSAVQVVLTTLRASGAQPVLGVSGEGGVLVDPFGIGTGLPEAATLVEARRAADPGGSEPGGLPADATTLTVFVTNGGIGVEIGRSTGEPARPEVIGSIVESLIGLADRVLLAAPAIKKATVLADPDVSLEQVVQVIDGLRDTCGRTAHGQPCAKRTVLFSTIDVVIVGAPAEPAKADAPTGGAGSIPLHLDAPAPGGLHLDTKPAANPQGLHL